MLKIHADYASTDRVTRPDSKGRVVLGDLAKGVSSYRVYIEEDTRCIMLEPFVEVPASEAWLFENKNALAHVRKGLEQSSKGHVRSLGSFSKFLKDEDK